MEVICPKCGSPDVVIYWDKVKEELSLCVCECSNAGMLKEFTYRLEEN